MSHGRRLTFTQFRTASLIALGHSTAKIADDLQVSEFVVKAEISSIFFKLDLRSRVQLAVYWDCSLFQIGLDELGCLPLFSPDSGLIN